MTTPSFHESVAMLTEDQKLFESTDYDQSHESLIQCGSLFSSTLKTFENDDACVESLPLEQRQRVMNTISEYQALLLPPKVCVGCSFFRRQKRSGPEYEKKMLVVHAKVLEAIFILRIAMRNFECEKIGENGKQYAAYANRMNSLANTLEGMVVKNNSHAKDEISSALESVEEFVKDFFATEMKDSLNEAVKRLKKTRELLHPGVGKDVTKRSLVTAQANLQEILNSAASVSAAKSKEKMDAVDIEVVQLKEASDHVMGAFKDLEEPMATHKMEETLEHHRLYAENLEKIVDNKLKVLKKTWKTIRGQSTYRPVAVYEVEMEDFKPANLPGTVGAGVGAAAAGTAKVGIKAASTAVMMATTAVTVPTKVVTSAGSMAVKGVTAGVTAAATLPNSAMKGVSDGANTAMKGVSDGANSAMKEISGGMSAGMNAATSLPNSAMKIFS